MKENSEIMQFFKLKRELDNAMDCALRAAAKRAGVTTKEADIVTFLFYGGDGTESETFSERGFWGEIESLCKNKYTEIKENKVFLTSRGEIAAKSLSQAQEKFFDNACKDISPEERFIISNVLNKISRNLTAK